MDGRILFGLDRLPAGAAAGDPRLPGVPAGGGLLRLDTEPLAPPAQARTTGADHAARLAALGLWLDSLAGDYARPRRQFLGTYLALLAATIERNREELAAGLARFEGLYAPEDWLWSAPRPLPRAWLPAALVPGASGPVFAEIAFRLETGPLVLALGAAAPQAGPAALWIPPTALADPAALGAILPSAFGRFWTGARLPRTPFRRPIPPPPAAAV